MTKSTCKVHKIRMFIKLYRHTRFQSHAYLFENAQMSFRVTFTAKNSERKQERFQTIIYL